MSNMCLILYPRWEAPEILCGEAHGSPADVFSFGMMIYEFITGNPPFHEIIDDNIFKKELCDKKTRPKLPKSLQPLLYNLIIQSWKNKPTKRPTMETIAAILERLKNNKN
eukprot:TRINITY_DN7306_c0_g2_i4.p1 TRINITY_DN7306_c0_g2~~TRINITY_DN7306_c0_g2_i4.p1  ORF type:complete len:110 (-),score=16.63 TRINITY_DN7306_c0_g2_i4:125-454(-)